MNKWVPANLISAQGIILGWPSNNPSRGVGILLVASCHGNRSVGQIGHLACMQTLSFCVLRDGVSYLDVICRLGGPYSEKLGLRS